MCQLHRKEMQFIYPAQVARKSETLALSLATPTRENSGEKVAYDIAQFLPLQGQLNAPSVFCFKTLEVSKADAADVSTAKALLLCDDMQVVFGSDAPWVSRRSVLDMRASDVECGTRPISRVR